MLAYLRLLAAMLLRRQVRAQVVLALERLAALLVRTEERAVNGFLVIVDALTTHEAHPAMITLDDVIGVWQQVLMTFLKMALNYGLKSTKRQHYRTLLARNRQQPFH